MVSKAVIFYLLALGSAYAQVAPPPTPGPNAPDLRLTQTDMMTIRQFVAGSQLHASQPDGTSHPLIDGAQLLSFLQQRADAEAKEAAMAAVKKSEDEKKVDPPK